MRIAVYGASGYTGRLVAAELARRQTDLVLIGRDRRRLVATAQFANLEDADLRTAAIEADSGSGVLVALRDCDAVINCAGPFVSYGAPVVRAAISAGCHYVDTSGEQGYIKRIFEEFSSPAERTGVTLMPGATDDCLPGDLIAHHVALQVEPVEELIMVHRIVSGGPSRGSLRTALQNVAEFASGGLSFEEGQWRSGPEKRRRSFLFPNTREPATVVKFAAPEVITIPRHVRARYVVGVTDASLLAGLSSVTAELVAAAPEGPTEERRRAAKFTVVAVAVGKDGRSARGIVEGFDTYGTTAVVAVEAARRIVADGAPPGVRAAAEVFDPANLLEFLVPHGVRWRVE